MTTTQLMARCELGEIYPEACFIPASATVEYIPTYLRDAHRAAGNPGSYPHNGAVRVNLCPGCAKTVLAENPEWAEKVARRGR